MRQWETKLIQLPVSALHGNLRFLTQGILNLSVLSKNVDNGT